MLRSISNTIKFALIFAGTMIGAGFASGQELLYFFIVYGSMGIGGIIFAGLAFAFFGWRICSLNRQFKENTIEAFMLKLCGKRAGAFFSTLLLLFLFTILTLMLAASGTIACDYLSLPNFFGAMCFAAFLYPASLRGFKSVASINTLVTPLLTVTILVVCLHSIFYHAPSSQIFFIAAHHAAKPAPHWMLSCLLYVSYNITLAITVLVPLSRKNTSEREMSIGNLIGGFLLALLATAIAITILIHCPNILSSEIPMLEISCSQNYLHALFYTGVFFAAMYTTSLTCLFGCATALSKKTRIPYPICTFLLLSGALLFIQLSFSQIIQLFFPLFGYACFWILWKLMITKH